MSEAVRVIPTWPHPWWEYVRRGDLVRIADEERVFRVLSASAQGAELQAVVLQPATDSGAVEEDA